MPIILPNGRRACDACIDPLREAEWQIMWGCEVPMNPPPLWVDMVCDEHLPDTMRAGMRRLPGGRRFWLDTTRLLRREETA